MNVKKMNYSIGFRKTNIIWVCMLDYKWYILKEGVCLTKKVEP